ncbi:MAG: hypothetical protein JNM40_05700 [Myxococcales bacterium]|nr:hypothetical protein [Myxococcales bacterium]
MLRWRGLEVTSEFAKSPNAKLVFLGNPASSLPLQLSLGETGSLFPSAAEPVPAAKAESIPKTTATPNAAPTSAPRTK